MGARFSDRVGATQTMDTLQIASISDALRNSLWNAIASEIFEGVDKKHTLLLIHRVCDRFLKKQTDEIPSEHTIPFPKHHRDWLRTKFYSPDFQWYQVYNLVEFVADNCNGIYHGDRSEPFRAKINKVLEEEMAAYRFLAGRLVPISSVAEQESIRDSLELASRHSLYGTRTHFETAVKLMARKPDPDYRNSIKESISALESLVKAITGEEGGGLERALAVLNTKVGLHGGFKAGLVSLYGFTSDASGIRHAILEEPSVGFDEAKFMLVACSALANFLIAKTVASGLLPPPK